MAEAGGSSRRGGARATAWPGIRGHLWVELCTDIAKNELPNTAYKRKYGLNPKGVQDFAVEFADEIAEIAQSIARAQDKAVAGLWITKKQNRLTEMQADAEDIQGLIDNCRDPDGSINPVLVGCLLENKQYLNLVRMKRALLASAADEIDGPRRQVEMPADERKVVSYLIDMGDAGDSLT